jgi:CHAT domain-containing protein/tetratricopeptide (TPR) repeat protein
MSKKTRLLFTLAIWLVIAPLVIAQISPKKNISPDSAISMATQMLNSRQFSQAKIMIDSLLSNQAGPVAELSLMQQLEIRSLQGRYFLLKPDLEAWMGLYEWIKGNEALCRSDKELILLIRLLNNAGVAFKRNMQLSDSEEAYLKASVILRKLKKPDYYLCGSVYANAGNSLKQMGEFDRSIEYLEQGIQYFKDYELKGKDPDTLKRILDLESKALDNLGLVYQSQANHKKAIEVFKTCIEFKVKNNQTGIISVLSNLVISLIEEGNYSEAISANEQILQTYTPGVVKDRIWALAQLNFFDLKHRMSGDSMKFISDLLWLISKINSEIPTAQDITVVANQLTASLLLSQGKYVPALDKLAQCLTAISLSRAEINSSEIPYQIKTSQFNKLIELMILNAQVYFEWGMKSQDMEKLEGSEKRYEFTLKLIDSLRNSLELQSSKLQVSNMQRSAYNQMLQVEYSIFQLTGDSAYIAKLFTTMEQSKSAGLWSSVKDIEIKLSKIPQQDLEKENNIRKKIADIQGSLIEASAAQVANEERVKNLQQQNLYFNQQIDSLIRVYRQKYPDYYKAKFDQSTISLQEVKRLLTPKQVLIEYSLADDYLYTLTISQSGPSITRVPISGKFKEDIAFFLDFMKGHAASLTSLARSRYCDAASGLSEVLLGHTVNSIVSKELMIIPDGTLSYIPFEALLEPQKNGYKQDYRKLPYLIRNHSISYGLTATILFYKPDRNTNPTRRVLAIAPSYDFNSENISDYIRKAQPGLPQLKGTYKESKAIIKMLGGRLLIRNQATESKFKQIAPKYSILHLAMHTIPDKSNSLNSGLVFTPGADKAEDGVLFGHEVYNLALNAWLTVLSACETGSGQMANGEGVLSFGRAFIVAGCPNLIMTMWTVDDHSSQELMVDFYESLLSGAGISDALQKSKLTFLQHADQLHSHPHYWAGFIEQGQNQILNISHRKPGLLFLFLFSSITILILVFLQLKKNPRRSRDIMETE